MCGIAGFLGNRNWTRTADLSWLKAVADRLAQAGEPAAIDAALDDLVAHFTDLMAFPTHMAAVADTAATALLTAVADRIDALETMLRSGEAARDVAVERTAERLRDYSWQLRTEVLGNIGRTLALLPDGAAATRPQHAVAWAAEQVLENLDRLEVRGRDSAGIALQITIDHRYTLDDLPAALRAGAAERLAVGDRHEGLALHILPDGRTTVRFTYKVATLIGRLGDNGAFLRARMRADAVLWAVARHADGFSAIAHTRWASHGAISLPNCHPLNARLLNETGTGKAATALDADADAMVALNGDIDNYRALTESAIEGTGHALPTDTTTDTKVIPVLFRLEGATGNGGGNADRFLATLRRLDGSMAIILQHPTDPERLQLGQKGSGQSLFVAEVNDGLIVASENYGLAPRARRSIPLAQVERGGLAVVLSTAAGEPALTARTVDDGAPASLKADAIEIFSRDIFRGRHDHFFEKEVHEAPASVRKTLTGRYRRQDRRVSFDLSLAGGTDTGPWAGLRARLADPAKPPIRRILVTGQGTAAIAAMGIEHLIRLALDKAPVTVTSAKASELSTNLDGKSLDDALVIAISQSGTTTDTNRTVDLARAAGAWIHAIVNRRNSPLVRKSDSHLFTSDGRDIEMAVASTKAFYSQVAAGKLTALCLADALGTLPAQQIHDEMVALEALPQRIQEVLDDEGAIAACARAYAPRNRYWAVVGNGANKVAAEEIRIKLSELCYKSIPVDYTEDKKHIDLSTEPLTLVVANDLAPLLAQDTAKEVAIFKAHNGKPIVFAAKGETCFAPYAEAVVHLPSAGAGLDFIMATVAGHLWGFHAALAIDAESRPFREVSAVLDQALADPERPVTPVATSLAAIIDRIADGQLDAALPASYTARLAKLTSALPMLDTPGGKPERTVVITRGQDLLRLVFEETSRPIDTIRHQAKTVTVGISRPGREISPLLLAALADLGATPADLAEPERQLLIALSTLVIGVEGGVRYHPAGGPAGEGADGTPLLQAVERSGRAKGVASRHDQPAPATGGKRRALRLGRGVLSGGASGAQTLALLPLMREPNWTPNGLVLLHLALVSQASLQQKIAILKDLRLYEDLFDAYHETGQADAAGDGAGPGGGNSGGGGKDGGFAAFLEKLAPRDLILSTPAELIRRA
ncbi:glucosamine--fructose-6-phosphate aminotransferase (isomerizing) [Nitrospirillum amazonense]|uniref:Glutamine--fructose-6-phosphate aminotransferase [isomerizing] n=1 Tax=Nitrospirillum amazonense TaxID=28077 RepID=A0A560JX18_9PROT|nr:SIS domain-containing protein [Nitrospirillum amazonense]TWB75611.1 glucosamine--fructose-6-phosphate aminotransferase (isomerizing) [Nitrospirillum amazonense]